MALSAVVKLLGGVRASVFAALAIASLILFAVQSYRLWLSHSKVELLEVKIQLKESAIEAIKAESAAQKKRAKTAVDQYEQLRNEKADAVVRVKTRVEKVYVTDKSASDWASTPVPSAVADQLR